MPARKTDSKQDQGQEAPATAVTMPSPSLDEGNPVIEGSDNQELELDLDPEEVEAELQDAEQEEEEEEEEEEEDPEVEYESDTTTQTGSDSLTWITWFCTLPGHEYFAEVTEDFIEDDFNLTGLNALVPFYKEALDMLLDVEPEEENLKIPDVSIIESSAELLYGLIHQRFIITRQGLQQMVEKYEAKHFGVCPRVYCNGTKVLPCGRSDLPGVDTVKLFCPNCIDTYAPPSSRFQGVDGSFFGTTLPHILFQTYKELVPSTSAINAQQQQQQKAPDQMSDKGQVETTKDSSSPPSPGQNAGASGNDATRASPARPPPSTSNSLTRVYVPKIYGFKVSERARSGPRMSWLRLRPINPERDLAKVDFQGRWRKDIARTDDDELASPDVDSKEASQESEESGSKTGSIKL